MKTLWIQGLIAQGVTPERAQDAMETFEAWCESYQLDASLLLSTFRQLPEVKAIIIETQRLRATNERIHELAFNACLMGLKSRWTYDAPQGLYIWQHNFYRLSTHSLQSQIDRLLTERFSAEELLHIRSEYVAAAQWNAPTKEINS